ncbi:MAG: outer membrane lipoprotein-sorting protein [Candidatus Methanoperedens sp.]|nr:outer membrane lipoprotein-sorting protein [Candidatus Methanoperedens sp.]
MNNMNIKLSILALLSIVLFAGCVEMSADQIASEMQKKYESVKDYKGTLVLSMSFEGESRESEMDFMYLMPDKSWTKITKGEVAGDIFVSNGTTMWLYNSTANEVTLMDISKTKMDNPGQADYGTIVKDMLKRNDIKMPGSEKIGGRDTFILEMTPKNLTNATFFINQKLWVDKETWMPLRMETFDKDGKMMMTMEYRNVEFNTGIPDSEFEFKIPQGARVITREMTLPEEMTLDEAREAVNFTVVAPEYLPEGYLLDKVIVFKFGEIQSLSISYKKGDEILSIYEANQSRYEPKGKFESVEINGIEARYVDTDFSKSLSWTWKGTGIAVSGTISKEELIKVAESIK